MVLIVTGHRISFQAVELYTAKMNSRIQRRDEEDSTSPTFSSEEAEERKELMQDTLDGAGNVKVRTTINREEADERKRLLPDIAKVKTT